MCLMEKPSLCKESILDIIHKNKLQIKYPKNKRNLKIPPQLEIFPLSLLKAK